MHLVTNPSSNIRGNSLPAEGFVRLKQIIGDPKANPPIPAIIPVGKSTWWAGVRTGRFPQPIHLGPATTVWRVRAIRDLIQCLESAGTDGKTINGEIKREGWTETRGGPEEG